MFWLTPDVRTQLKSITDSKFVLAVHFSFDVKRIINSPFSSTGFGMVEPTFLYLYQCIQHKNEYQFNTHTHTHTKSILLFMRIHLRVIDHAYARTGRTQCIVHINDWFADAHHKRQIFILLIWQANNDIDVKFSFI